MILPSSFKLFVSLAPSERAPEPSTDSNAQNMPSANAFADLFKAALAPVLSQLTNLNENVSSVLLNGHDYSDEDGQNRL